MAQHDQVLDNGSGLAVRTDMNAALAALFSSSSGPIEPTVKTAGQLWFDTGTAGVPKLKIRASDNASWVDILGGLGNFSTGINLTGAEVAGVSSAYVGFTAADIGFGSRKAGTPAGSPNRFVWNDKPDLTGTDVAVMSETGALTLKGATIPANSRSALTISADLTLTSTLAFNGYVDTTGPTLKTIAAGYIGQMAFDQAAGVLSLSSTTASVAAGAAPTLQSLLSFQPNKTAQFAGQVFFVGDAAFGLTISGNSRYFQAAANNVLNWDGATGNWGLYSTGGVRWTCRNSDGAFIVPVKGYQPGGGVWADTSDERIKTVTSDYESGLEQVKGLRPVRYTFKGNDTNEEPRNTAMLSEDADKSTAVVPYVNSPHYQVASDATEFVGLIAQEVEAVMPGMVSQRAAWIDGVEVSDLRDLDTTNLIFALVNAVKELAAKVEALEAAAP